MTARASTGSTILLLLIAWGCGIAGILWAYLLALAGASSTVPQMSVSHMLMTLPLPIIAALTAWFVIQRARHGAVGRGFLWAAIPGVLFAALGLFLGLSAYFSMT
jgi:hypothetical protein